MTQLTLYQENIFYFSEEKLELLKKTVCKEASNTELELFVHICQRTGLDPFAKQIYAIKRKGTMTFQTSIDGYRLIAERTKKYSPGKEPTFVYDKNNILLSATSYVKKQTEDGSWHEVAATAFYNEYVQAFNGKPTQFWEKMPHSQLAKCAEALALRKAFPGDFSGLYTKEEMAQSENNDESLAQEILPVDPKSLNDFLDQWGEQKEEFIEYMNHLMKVMKWDEATAIERLKLKPEYTRAQFEHWLEKKLSKSA